MKWIGIKLFILLGIALNAIAWPHFLHRERLQKLRQKNFLQNLFPFRRCDVDPVTAAATATTAMDVVTPMDNAISYHTPQQQGLVWTYAPASNSADLYPSLQYSSSYLPQMQMLSTSFNGQPYLNQLSSPIAF